MSFFKKILSKIPFLKGSEKTESGILAKISETDSIPSNSLNAVLERVLIKKEELDDLEEELIRSDLGVDLAMDFTELLRKELKAQKEIYKDDLQDKLKEFLLGAFTEVKIQRNKAQLSPVSEKSGRVAERTSSRLRRTNDRSVLRVHEDHEDDENAEIAVRLHAPDPFQFSCPENVLTVVMILGINGVGKTTSIAKLAYKYRNSENKKVLIAAGDTFRAAAEDQLRTWAERTGADLIEMPHGSKSSAVVYKAIEKAKNENYDLVLIDTAGRLHNKKNLMEELSKIQEVVKKNLDGQAYHLETMLVLDASMGQNSLIQAQTFNELCEVNSIILTKFDGSSKAGTVFSIAHKLKIPVKFLGVGEKMEDLEEFSPEAFTKKYF
jgi:fused signal recognition particle receptor